MKWTGGANFYVLNQNGKTIQRSAYVDDLFWTSVELVRKGEDPKSFAILDESTANEDITESVASFCSDLSALRSS